MPFLLRVFVTKEFVQLLEGLLKWIENKVSNLDNSFTTWFKRILLDEPGVMTRKFFTTSAIPIAIRSFCYLAEERFVDDDSVRGLMELFSMLYGADGRYLFILPLTLQGWRNDAHWADWE